MVNEEPDWKAEFFRLLLSKPNDAKRAFELKQLNLHSPLYRYRSIKNEENKPRFVWLTHSITKGHLHCLHPKLLWSADPFDTRSVLSSKRASDYLSKEWLAHYSDQEPIKSFMEQFDLTRALETEDPLGALWQSSVEESIRQGYLSEPAQALTFPDVNKLLMSQIENTNDNFNKLLQMTRIACFSEVKDSLAMWLHYADKHEGVCLEYDVKQIDNPIALFSLFPVNYSNPADAVKIKYGRPGTFSRMEWIGYVLYSCTQKYDCWAYEKEWRFVMTPWSNAKPAYLNENVVTITFHKPSKIILGALMSDDQQENIIKLANAISPEIIVTKMRITPYGLEESGALN